ncbi:MAG: hemin uptake protein HemP [Gammaproteobacteria bacterium]|nr:hemin uptake protein HemP [Gammaproteobacteria bacterium]
MPTVQPEQASEKKELSPSKELQRINSTELFRGKTRLIIQHYDNEYFLRITRQGKLILTK